MGQPINKITLKGFKSIRSLEDFPLRNLNILIGANGAGKSNFVSFFQLLRAMANECLQAFVLEQGGGDGFFFMGPKHTQRVSARLQFGEHVYEFELAPTGSPEVMIGNEQTRSVDDPRSSMESWGRESNLKHRHEGGTKPEWFDTLNFDTYESVSSSVVYHFHDTSILAPMRRPGSVRDNEYLRPDAANLGACLLMLHDQHRGVYERIRDIVRLAAPFFDDFKFRPRASNGDETLHLEWTQRGSDYPFLVTRLSDGTLRFIALATALLQPNPPSTILLDEPELGLHPYALTLLAELLKKATEKTQVIVSTQSASLLDNFEAEDIIVVERENGASTFKRLSSGGLEEWLKDYSLGELWQKNVIGGRPSDG
ncbi:MAG: AAA family ATPase [Phycisphaerales bacterium]